VTIAEIISWWIVTPIIGFWIGGVIGRYIYPKMNRRVDIRKSPGPPLTLKRTGLIPTPTFGPNTTWSELGSTAVVLVIGCYMAFSAGASNVPNATAPLIGEAGLEPDIAIVIATLAIGLGGFTIANRTMESVTSELSDIPLLAALFVMITASTITTLLSWIGIPISLVMATVMTIVGIGWGPATRPITFREAVTRDTEDSEIVTGAITQEEITAAPIGDAEPTAVLEAGDLFNPGVVINTSRCGLSALLSQLGWPTDFPSRSWCRLRMAVRQLEPIFRLCSHESLFRWIIRTTPARHSSMHSTTILRLKSPCYMLLVSPQ